VISEGGEVLYETSTTRVTLMLDGWVFIETNETGRGWAASPCLSLTPAAFVLMCTGVLKTLKKTGRQ
jgi:hypothetical protein